MEVSYTKEKQKEHLVAREWQDVDTMQVSCNGDLYL